MNILGVSAGFHDAALAVINPAGEILFAGHSERYSKKKNDADCVRVSECRGKDSESVGENGALKRAGYKVL